MFEKVHVRRAIPEDANAIATVHMSSWQFAYAGLLPEVVIRSQSLPDRAAFWREFVANPDNWPVFLLEDSCDIVGFSSPIPARDDDVDRLTVSELAAIYLDESASGKGLGAALLRNCWDESRSRGCTSMVLWVLESNSRALSFYRKHGFVADGESKYEEQSAANEIRMRVDIPGHANL